MEGHPIGTYSGTGTGTRTGTGRAAVLGLVAWVLACASAAGPLSGCKGKGRAKKKARADGGGVPAPLKDPAGFCFSTCARKVQCRLGEGEGEEQRKILRAEMERCSRNCLEWIKGHPYDAVALHLCYAKRTCNDLVSCLGKAQRLMKDSADPQKKRQCFKLCVYFGQCEGNERACLRACTVGDLRVYRALTKCENRGCPQVKECVEGHMKQKVVP